MLSIDRLKAIDGPNLQTAFFFKFNAIDRAFWLCRLEHQL
jgi:hypothetical protein